MPHMQIIAIGLLSDILNKEMMKIYKHRLFQQWAKTEQLSDKVLRQAIDELTQGLYEANLGSGLYKKRIAMPGRGKRGSYRTLIAFKSGQNAFFLYGFAKNVSDNISSSGQVVYRKLAKDLLNLLPDELQSLLEKGKLFEVNKMKATLLDVAHEIANDLYDAGIIDAVTMREYEGLCIPPVRELNPKQIKQIRLAAKVSQALFAKYLNTSTSTVKQWEQGSKHPRGTSLKLLNLVADRGLDAIL